MSKELSQLEYVEHYCELVSIHCNELMEGDPNEDTTDIQKLALAVSFLNSAVRSLRNAYIKHTHPVSNDRHNQYTWHSHTTGKPER